MSRIQLLSEREVNDIPTRTYKMKCKIAWANLLEADYHVKYNKRGTYSLSVINLDEDQELYDALLEAGIPEERFDTVEKRIEKSKDKDYEGHPEVGTRLVLKKYAHTDDMEAVEPPIVRDAANKPWERNWVRTGTVANIIFDVMELPANPLNPSGIGTRLTGVQILNEPAGQFDPDSLFNVEQEYLEEAGGDMFDSLEG